MWTKSKSLMLSIFCTRLFLVLLVAGGIFAPQIVAWYFGESPDAQAIHLAFRITIYCCAVPGLFLLLCLHRLLRNLRRERVFEQENVTLLRAISWLCIAVGVVTLVSGFYYTSFFLVAAAAAFCGLIGRVVKNVFEQAIEIKSENDSTI